MLLAVICLVAGCASPDAYHTFYFETADNKNVKVLDWRYGDYQANRHWVKVAEAGGQGLGREISILKPVGDYFYVKWMVPPSPEIHELNVDLKSLLPWSMMGAEVRPTFNASNELEVYFSIPDARAPNAQTFRRRSYIKSTIYQIYPIRRPVVAE